jgi:hypothetical protein
MRVEFADLMLELPEGWCDISADLSPDAPPTLARETGVGALQFSVARYRSGAKPVFDEGALEKLLVDFCRTHSLGPIKPSVTSKTLCVGGVSNCPEEVTGVWYVSNGADLALVTYTALQPADPETEKELCEARAIVESIEL